MAFDEFVSVDGVVNPDSSNLRFCEEGVLVFEWIFVLRIIGVLSSSRTTHKNDYHEEASASSYDGGLMEFREDRHG